MWLIFDYTTILTQQKGTNLAAIEAVEIEKVALYKGGKQTTENLDGKFRNWLEGCTW